MSSHSGTIGRKRGGSGGGSEYYFGAGGLSGGEQRIRRQRSAEWHSRHGYSSSEDEYQNTGQSAFDTQLLATLLLQSQQLANMDRYNSDADNEEVTTSLLTDYSNPNRAQKHRQHQQQLPATLCSPQKQQTAAFFPAPASNPAAAATAMPTNASSSTSTRYQTSGASVACAAATAATAARSTNPFLNSKFDSPQSNSDSLSERLSYSGSSAVLDRVHTTAVAGAATNDFDVENSAAAAFLMPCAAAAGISASTTASSLQNPVGRENSLRASRSKSARLGRASGMTSSSSGASCNSNAAAAAAAAATTSSSGAAVASAMAAALASRSEREKLKLQQIQMELREFAQSEAAAAAAKFDDGDLATSGTESEPPPEPAPPEIPPRTQSLLMSLRKSADFQLKYEEKGGDQKHEEFIPASQLQQMQQQQQLQKDYLVADNSRSSETQTKSMASSDSPSQHG